MNNNNTITPTIYATYDYDIFVKINGNRELNEANIRRIENSLKEKQLPIPIVVNEKMEVIDGQHRLAACRNLGLPVYYTIIDDAEANDCKLLNQEQTKWKQDDFLHYYAQLGSMPAQRILELRNKYELKTRVVVSASGKNQNIIAFVSGYNKDIDWFSEETFSEEDFERTDKLLARIKDVYELMGGEKLVRKYVFYSVLSELITVSENTLDFQRLKTQLSSFKDQLCWKVNKDQMMRQIIYSYNFKKRAPYLDLITVKGKEVFTINEKTNHFKTALR